MPTFPRKTYTVYGKRVCSKLDKLLTPSGSAWVGMTIERLWSQEAAETWITERCQRLGGKPACVIVCVTEHSNNDADRTTEVVKRYRDAKAWWEQLNPI